MSKGLKISKTKNPFKNPKIWKSAEFRQNDSQKLSKNWKTAILGTSKYENQQKSVGKKSGQLLSRDRSTQKQISQTTDHQN